MTESVLVLSTADSQKWTETLERLPQQDIYFLPEYHRVYELNGDGTAYAFVFEQGEDIYFYPFLLQRIERVGSEIIVEELFDIQTVYGYSGPLTSSTDLGFLGSAWKAFSEWCQSQHIVAEFVRFHPLLDNFRYVGAEYRVLHDRDTVVVSLDCTEAQIWETYPSLQRNMVRKALKAGLSAQEVEPSTNLATFEQLYGKTMSQNRAQTYYFFPENYFNNLFSLLNNQTKLFNVTYLDQVIASTIIFQYGNCLHYHLSGSDSQFRDRAPNNLLLHTVIEWGLKHGMRLFHLGGGRTSDPQDYLLRFKGSISSQRRHFYIGKRVHNPDSYQRLCSLWMKQKGIVDAPAYLLMYRLEQ